MSTHRWSWPIALVVLLTACSSSTSTPATTPAEGAATRPLHLPEAASTPPVDRSIASVPLDEIIFDTFGRGPLFTLDGADDDAVAELLDAIGPIDAPSYQQPAQAEWLDDGDIVLGYVDPLGAAWAYPIRILNFHEIVNDELGRQPVVVTYCPLCGSGVVFDRTLDDGTVTFSNTSALYENDMVMVDRESGSYWWQVKGEAIVGARTGVTLEVLPSTMTTWADWVARHPETAVLERPTRRSYDDPFGSYAASLDAGTTPFPVDEVALSDTRLRSSAIVTVLQHRDETVAVAVAPARKTTITVGGRAFTVELDGVGAVVTNDGGQPAPSRTMFWFAAVAAHPDITVAN